MPEITKMQAEDSAGWKAYGRFQKGDAHLDIIDPSGKTYNGPVEFVLPVTDDDIAQDDIAPSSLLEKRFKALSSSDHHYKFQVQKTPDGIAVVFYRNALPGGVYVKGLVASLGFGAVGVAATVVTLPFPGGNVAGAIGGGFFIGSAVKGAIWSINVEDSDNPNITEFFKQSLIKGGIPGAVGGAFSPAIGLAAELGPVVQTLVGGGVNAVTSAIEQKLSDQPITFKSVAGSFAVGCVGAAVGQTVRKGLQAIGEINKIADNSLFRVAQETIVGAAVPATTTVLSNALNDRPLTEGLATAAISGAVVSGTIAAATEIKKAVELNQRKEKIAALRATVKTLLDVMQENLNKEKNALDPKDENYATKKASLDQRQADLDKLVAEFNKSETSIGDTLYKLSILKYKLECELDRLKRVTKPGLETEGGNLQSESKTLAAEKASTNTPEYKARVTLETLEANGYKFKGSIEDAIKDLLNGKTVKCKSDHHKVTVKKNGDIIKVDAGNDRKIIETIFNEFDKRSKTLDQNIQDNKTNIAKNAAEIAKTDAAIAKLDADLKHLATTKNSCDTLSTDLKDYTQTRQRLEAHQNQVLRMANIYLVQSTQNTVTRLEGNAPRRIQLAGGQGPIAPMNGVIPPIPQQQQVGIPEPLELQQAVEDEIPEPQPLAPPQPAQIDPVPQPAAIASVAQALQPNVPEPLPAEPEPQPAAVAPVAQALQPNVPEPQPPLPAPQANVPPPVAVLPVMPESQFLVSSVAGNVRSAEGHMHHLQPQLEGAAESTPALAIAQNHLAHLERGAGSRSGKRARARRSPLVVLINAQTERVRGLANSFVYTNHDRYEGEMVNGVRQGRGTYFKANGDRVEGTWVSGRLEGEGIYTFANRDVFRGNFVQGEASGRGSYTMVNGDTFLGNWNDGNLHGHGMYHSENGDYRYEGEWRNGQENGDGMLRLANGEVFQGNWRNGDLYGQGTFTSANGRNRYVGNWVNDQPNGAGIFTYADGSVYDGRWRNGLRHGQGRFTTPTGEIHEGEWRDDRWQQ